MANMAKKAEQSSYGKLLSNTIVFAIGSFSSKVLVLLLIPIYTNYLSTSELGKTDILQQIANWLMPVVSLTIAEAIIRFGLDKAYDKRKVFTLGNIVCFGGLAAFAVILTLVSLSGIADTYIGGYSVILYIFIFTSSLKTLYATFVRAMEKVKLFAFNGILTTFFTLFFTAAFYMVLPEDIMGDNTGILKYLLAIILSDFISIVFLTYKARLWRYFDIKRFDRDLLHVMLQYSVPLIPAQLLWLITNSSDAFMTTHYLGSHYNGILSATYKIPNIVATVYMMFGQAWNMSAITENESKDRDKFYENVFDFNQSLLYILCASCLLIIQPLTKIMIGEDFQSCIKYSPIMIYSTIFSCFTTFMGSIYLATKETKKSLFTSLISGLVNVGLNIILIPTIKLYGPPISTVAAYLTVFIIRTFDSRKLVPFRINFKKMIVNNIIIILMMFVCLFETNLMHNPIAYMFLFLLFSIVIILNMKAISSVFYKLLPKRIADRLSKITKPMLAVILLGILVYIALDIVTKGFIIYGTLFAAFCYFANLKDRRRMLIITIALPLCMVIRQGITVSLIMLLVLCLISAYTLRSKRSVIACGVSAYLILLSVIPWITVFVSCIAMILGAFCFRERIIAAARAYIRGGTKELKSADPLKTDSDRE